MLTTLLIFWPLLAALVILVLDAKLAKVIALSASLVELIICAVVVIQFEPTSEKQFVVNFPWVASLGINFYAGIDGISLLLVLLTSLLTPLIVLSSFKNNYEKPRSFYSLILFMQMALVGVFVALDGFLF